jgi:hypothetical protein
MLLKDVKAIIEVPETYMVHAEQREFMGWTSVYFPDRRTEPLFTTVSEAWETAQKFAEKTEGQYYNIYIVDNKCRPVESYEERRILNKINYT